MVPRQVQNGSMANILKSLLFCAIIALALVYFSKDSTPEGGDAEVSLIPLEGVIVQPPAPALVAEPEPEPEPIAVVIDVELVGDDFVFLFICLFLLDGLIVEHVESCGHGDRVVDVVTDGCWISFGVGAI